jgi:hypothetical protein
VPRVFPWFLFGTCHLAGSRIASHSIRVPRAVSMASLSSTQSNLGLPADRPPVTTSCPIALRRFWDCFTLFRSNIWPQNILFFLPKHGFSAGAPWGTIRSARFTHHLFTLVAPKSVLALQQGLSSKKITCAPRDLLSLSRTSPLPELDLLYM